MCGIYAGPTVTTENDFPLRLSRGNFTKSKDFTIGDRTIRLEQRVLPMQSSSMISNSPYPIEVRGLNKHILFSGEIYSIPEDIVKAESEPEMIRELFRRYPIREATEHLMNYADWFGSFIIYSEGKGICAFTDPLGRKQLYYNDKVFAIGNDTFYPAAVDNDHFSQKPGGNTVITSSLDQPVLRTYSTHLSNVKRMQPGVLYMFHESGGGISPVPEIARMEDKRVSTKPFAVKPVPSDRLAVLDAELRMAIRGSISNRVLNYTGKAKPDNRISLLTSGGLDSSILLFELRDLFPDLKIDCVYLYQNEGEYNQLQALFRRLKVPFDWLRPVPIRSWYPEDYSKLFEYYDSPVDLGSVKSQWDIHAFIRETGLSRKIFTGDGADELFNGYNRGKFDDYRNYDVFTELPFYHNVRIDRISGAFTQEVRCPFQSPIVQDVSFKYPWEETKNKMHLRRIYKDLLPSKVIKGGKTPLRSKDFIKDKQTARQKFANMFTMYNQNKLNNKL